MKSIVIALTLLVTNVFALDDFDLYRYGPSDKIVIEREAFILKFVFYDSFESLQVGYKEATGDKKEGEVRGFTMVSRTQDICTVHVVKAQLWDDREDLTILGHEVYHCTFASHTTVVADKDQEKTDEDKLLEEDRRLELEGLEEECESNTRFDFIAGCKELLETK